MREMFKWYGMMGYPDTAQTHAASFVLGSLYAEEKNFSAAVPLLEHALKLSERCNRLDSIAFVPYLQKYA
jgi:hypothetical protein